MTIRAEVLTSLPYVAKIIEFPAGPAVLVASEGAGPVVHIDTETWEVTTVAEGPGGCLDIVQVPGSDAIFMIGGCHVGYDFYDAGVYVTPIAGGTPPVKLFDIPFVHRLHSYITESGVHLVAATIAQSKRDKEDWLRPGAVYVAEIPDERLPGSAGERSNVPSGDTALSFLPAGAPIPLRPVLTELHKNHGLLSYGHWLYISGAEGMYRASIPQRPDERWRFHKVFNGEISELAFIDVDLDGQEEMVAIGPFHGDSLSVYDAVDGVPGEQRLTHSIAFGHGLWAGTVAGKPSVIVGNRSGHKNLELLQWNGNKAPEMTTIGEGTGTAQVTVVHGDGADHIVATNQEQSQVVRYTVEPVSRVG